MTKPWWEEEWKLAGTEVIPNGDRDVSAKFYGPRDSAQARARGAHAAPDMARALKRLLLAFPQAYATEEEVEAVAAVRAAIAKAGVPLS